MTRPTLREVAELSLFASRSLKAMVPGDAEEEKLARFEALASAPWSRERIREQRAAFAYAQEASPRHHAYAHWTKFHGRLRFS